MVSWDGKMTPKCHWNPYMWRCIRAVVKFLNCAVYFPDDNSEKYPGILYPGDMTVYRYLSIPLNETVQNLSRSLVLLTLLFTSYYYLASSDIHYTRVNPCNRGLENSYAQISFTALDWSSLLCSCSFFFT